MKKSVYALLLVALLILPILASTLVHADGYYMFGGANGEPVFETGTAGPSGETLYATEEQARSAAQVSSSQSSNTATTKKEIKPFVANKDSYLPVFIQEKLYIWEIGGDYDKNASALIMKYLLLFIVIILTYSALTSAEFPEGTTSRVILSVIVGFMATFMITTKELLTMLTSYSALGVAFGVFLPIVILGFFTMMVAKKMNPTGIFLQKIAWVIYSAYLFIRTGGLLIADYYKNAPTENWAKLLYNIFQPILPSASSLTSYDTPMLFVLAVTAIAVFVFMVWKNEYVEKWIAHQAIDSEKEAYKGLSERSREKMKIDAETLQKAGSGKE